MTAITDAPAGMTNHQAAPRITCYEEENADEPTRLIDLDFGAWQGKRRPRLILSASEEYILDKLKGLTLAEGNISPIDLDKF
jgi:hypothetical protein